MSDDKILEFSGVTVAPAQHLSGLSDANFSVGRGELALLLVEEESDQLPFCDLAEGLTDPDKGSIRIMGQSWKEMPIFLKEDMRGLIGRVFECNGWVSNLTVQENIELSERHHTLRPDADIRAEAEQFSHFLGLPPVLSQRPDFVVRSVLRRAEWIRAFMGKPSLLLLEHPENEVPVEFLPKLIELISAARAKQSAVVWITGDREIWGNRNFIDGSRFKISKGKLSHAQEV